MSSPPALPHPPVSALGATAEEPSRLTGFAAKCGRSFDALVGVATVIPVLAVISAIPLLNLLSLGYLLEASGRVARSGRLRDGWIGLAGFAVVGKILLAGWVALLPARLVHSFWRDAELIAPGSANATALRAILVVLLVVTVLHLLWAVIRGGKWRHFLWPAPLRFCRWIGSEFSWRPATTSLLAAFRQLRLHHFFRLGALGFAGAALWLVFPVLILMTASSLANPGISFLLSLLGSLLLGISVLYLPFLQTRFALTGRFGEFFDPFAVRRSFRKAPLAFWLALAATLLFALPLYLLKIELTPSEVAWLPNVVFVLFIFPARILLGWALARSERRETARIWVSRWAARLAALPVVAVYVFLVWISQYLSWHGTLGLFEQHAFLVPAPLLGL
jgi:hypothetical protein